jgi:arginyl-tRNA synthetase
MKQKIANAIADIVKRLYGFEGEVELSRPEEQFGDYSTNIALRLAKPAGWAKDPSLKLAAGGSLDIAETISAELESTLPGVISNVSVARPGFINLRLTDSALKQLASEKPTKDMTGQEVVAEYSDPNPFKALHAGHLYTTIVGDAIARLLDEAGANVHRINYGGDVGLHVGKAMWSIIHFLGGEHPEKLANIPEYERAVWVSQRYSEGNTAYESDPASKLQIIETNKKVYAVHQSSDHDTPFAQIYWTCRQWSYDGFDNIYNQLGIVPFERTLPESEVTPAAIEMVQKGLADSVLEESEGAIVFKGEDHGLHTRVFMNSGGLPTYEAKDLGLASIKWRDYHFDKSFIITASDIIEYMKVVTKVLTHFYPEVAPRSVHLTHGLIKLPGGEKMSSRKGNAPMADDILIAAAAANKSLNGKDDEGVVVSAVKYAFLKQRVGGNLIYDPVESVSLEGNSGPYLQYAHARARSILRKAADADTETALNSESDETLEAGERTLLRKISEYHEAVDKAVSDLMPHYICTYLYELAQTFNRFYENNKVIGDPRQTTRLQLVEQYANTLKQGLNLLGIVAPETM